MSAISLLLSIGTSLASIGLTLLGASYGASTLLWASVVWFFSGLAWLVVDGE